MTTTEKPASVTGGLFAELNTLRAARNQEPLKVWKGSIKALEQTIAAYKTKPITKVAPAVAEGAYENSRKAEASTELKGTHARKREAIAKANKPKSGDPVKGAKDSGAFKLKRVVPNVPANETSTKESAMPAKSKKAMTVKSHNKSEFVSLADIARDLDIEPKLARARARRSDEMTKLAQGDAWVFKPADVAKVKKFLKD